MAGKIGGVITPPDHGIPGYLVDRFWSKVDKNGPIPEHRPELGPCSVWTAGLSYWGYGAFNTKPHGPMVRAHRFAWLLTVGPVPDGLWVLHHCDNPQCVRTDGHLFLGTAADNHRDMMSKGRGSPPPLHRGGDTWVRRNPERRIRGERHHNAKLTAADVAAIRALRPPHPPGHRLALARQYGISKTHVGRILSGESWAAA